MRRAGYPYLAFCYLVNPRYSTELGGYRWWILYDQIGQNDLHASFDFEYHAVHHATYHNLEHQPECYAQRANTRHHPLGSPMREKQALR